MRHIYLKKVKGTFIWEWFHLCWCWLGSCCCNRPWCWWFYLRMCYCDHITVGRVGAEFLSAWPVLHLASQSGLSFTCCIAMPWTRTYLQSTDSMPLSSPGLYVSRQRHLVPPSNPSWGSPASSVTNFASLSANFLASFCKWSCCGRGKDLVNQHSQQTPHLCCHWRLRIFVSSSLWSFSTTLSRGMPVCWSPIPACLSQALH